ncbi:MAG TPA: sulfite exporter TauE/SafE family protein [Nocardioides sp.]|uniref:sulfite exporter TauE/SafE family protein n=1 Tax=Nocardioides sp. TaxID=35761 RepID=UPI002E37089E|nr:sulfite exporter TauE/SafE family protein [Nocardioides sp.]HEX5090946.1 sulfite exporter TauE/SafE family protein [Nocardioides sp.]
MDPTTYAVIAAAVVVGSTVQSAVGLGVGLVAAPVTALLEPTLMPGTLLIVAVLMPCLTLIHDHHDIDWRGLGWALPARLPGTVVGVWVVATLTERELGIMIGLVVLLAVVVTWRAVVVPVNRLTLSAAGFTSGITGTATSIGGPPIAIVYQHRPARQIRTTMAVYFLIGATLSLGALMVAGDLTGKQVVAGVALLPFLALGTLAGAWARRSMPAHVVRPSVLIVSSASAVVLLVRSVVGG